MSKLSLDELKELAKEVFEASPEVDHVLAFSDGNIFLPTSKSAADMHSRSIKSEAYTIPNPDFKTKSEDGLESENDDASLLGDSVAEKTESKEPRKLTKKEQAEADKLAKEAADKLADEQAKAEAQKAEIGQVVEQVIVDAIKDSTLASSTEATQTPNE